MTRNVRGRVPGETTPMTSGAVAIPASKSHTIRALLMAAFAEGTSRLRRPLASRDTMSCRAAVEALGAEVTDDGPDWVVRGFGSRPAPAPGTVIDVGNSGTTLYLSAALAALSPETVRFDGDSQIRRRSAAPLLAALEGLGASVEASEGGCAPFSVRGPLKAGPVAVDCPVSQYLSGLLLAAPLIPSGGPVGENGSTGGDSPSRGRASAEESVRTGPGAPQDDVDPGVTRIEVKTLNEAPYVGITLDWLDGQGIGYERDGWREFSIPAGQCFRPFDKVVPADWSSATFFLVAAAITGGTLVLEGVDPGDSQGDKAVVGMLEAMGCAAEPVEGGLRFRGAPLAGTTLDLNATPDALPALAVAACYAEGETRLVNCPQARLKETDRIAVMASELRTLGADIEETSDGLVIRGRRPSEDGCVTPVLKGALVNGHDDHRVVMALAVSALGCCGQVGIKGAEAADVTFPGFFDLLNSAVGRS